jgi:hypothetical protein
MMNGTMRNQPQGGHVNERVSVTENILASREVGLQDAPMTFRLGNVVVDRIPLRLRGEMFEVHGLAGIGAQRVDLGVAADIAAVDS